MQDGAAGIKSIYNPEELKLKILAYDLKLSKYGFVVFCFEVF
jgi:hypothetical protein